MNFRSTLLFILVISLFSHTSAQNNAADSTVNSKYYKLFSPLTYYRSSSHNFFSLNEEENSLDASLMNVYLKRPEFVQTTEIKLKEASKIKELKKPVESNVKYHNENIDIIEDIDASPEMNLVVTKPNFWNISGDYYLQFLQNYISENWYKGGESNYSAVASAVFQANYNNKQKLTFDNKLEMKLGFQTSRADSLHTFKTSEDLIRYTGKLGVQATQRWYYTLQLISYTQFLSGYKVNDRRVYSDFFSPFNLNLALGMSYKVEMLDNKLTGSVTMSPLSYNFRYVGRQDLATRYGLKPNHSTLNDFGSQLTADLTWKVMDNVKWRSRFYYYTTYKKVEMEWENTFTFTVNKYISTNIFVYPRFDDSSNKKDKKIGYFQMKEYSSLGLAYSF